MDQASWILSILNSGLHSSPVLYIFDHVLPQLSAQDEPFRYRPRCPCRLKSQKSW